MSRPEAGGLYLFLGPDRVRKLQRIQALERSLGIGPLDRHQLDGADVSGAQLLALCRQQPAESPLRLVVVDQAHRLDAACVDGLLRQAPVIAQNTCLVLLVEGELGFRHPLIRAGTAMTTEQFSARESVAAKPFALTDALGLRDPAAALGAMRDQVLAGRDPLEILPLIAWQVQRWVVVKRLLEADSSVESIVAVTGLRLWQVERLRSEVARRSLESLQQLLERCWQADAKAKTGRTIPELTLEGLVVEICA